MFPETFSFRVDRHDPAELYLQLDDLARKPQLLSPRANSRDAELLISRLVLGVPRYVEGLLERLEAETDLAAELLLRVHEDVALLAQILSRFVSERVGVDRPGIRMAGYHLRKLVFRSLHALAVRRVDPDYLDAYVAGEVDLADPTDDLSDSGFFHTMEAGDQDAVNRSLVRLTERAFYRWLEEVCLDEQNQAFESEDSPFRSREAEVLAAVLRDPEKPLLRDQDLSPFLRRPRNRDCLRVLRKLSAWFLRQYDVTHGAAMIQHTEHMARGGSPGSRRLGRHRTGNYLAVLAVLAAPFAGAAFAYQSAPRLFDLLCALELGAVGLATTWFLVYQFCWRRDLAFFHASIPRIAAGIIVGYLPIFFIDEIWGFVDRPFPILAAISLLLGFVTLLYLYIEVQRRLGEPDLAFARARQIFLLGVVQAFGAGLLITGLTGGYMASRNWSAGERLPVESLRETLPAFVGELPRIVGVEPFYTFPAAIFVMVFFSFFIGTFLQLLWEDMPITEPL